MGERFLQSRAASFRHQQCIAFERELQSATLFSQTAHALERVYACTGPASIAQLIGAKVLLRTEGSRVAVLHGNSDIGCAFGRDADDVASAIAAEPQCPGMALAVIEDASSVTGDFIVRLISHKEPK